MKRVICIFLIVLFSFNLSGCIEQKTTNTNTRDYISYNINSLPKDLIMLDNKNLREEALLVNLFEGLVKTNKEGKIIPALAEKWTISENGLSYKFVLKDNAKWSDGDNITASDFVDLFSNILKYENNLYASDLYCIYGAKNFRLNKLDLNNLAIKALDSKTLQINLNYPCNYFLKILSKPIYTLRNIDNKLENWEKQYNNIRFSGPFVIGNINGNKELNKKSICLLKNKNYWNKSNVTNSKIVMYSINGSELSLSKFDTNTIDIFINPPISETSRLIKENLAFPFNTLNINGIFFNLNKKSIVNDINLRKCIFNSLDFNSIYAAMDPNIFIKCTSYVPSFIKFPNGNQFGFKHNIKTQNYNKAREYLKASKYNGEKLKFIYLNTTLNERVIEVIKNNLTNKKSSKFNLNIEFVSLNKNDLTDSLINKDYDLAFLQNDISYNDVFAFLNRWCNNSNFNIYGFNDFNYDSLLSKAKLEKDSKKQEILLIKAEKMLYDNVTFIPFYNLKNLLCKKDYIDGLNVNEVGNIDFSNLKKNK